MGGMGGAQPLAATLNGAVFLGIDVDPARIDRRVRTGYCDRIAFTLDEALKICEEARAQKQAVSVGLVGNCAELMPEIVRRGVKVDVVTDQTSAHDPPTATIMGFDRSRRITPGKSSDYIKRSMHSMAQHVEVMLALKRSGAVAFDYGNNIRKQALDGGCADAFEIPRFVPEYIRPLFCEGKGPSAGALSGDANDIRKTDDLALELFPEDKTLNRYCGWPGSSSLPGIAGAHLLLGERAEMGEAINDS
jgi:urocanate hydratase